MRIISETDERKFPTDVISQVENTEKKSGKITLLSEHMDSNIELQMLGFESRRLLQKKVSLSVWEY